MIQKLKSLISSIKINFIYFQIIILFRKKREFLFKWMELKSKIITEQEFTEWMTQDILK